MTQRYESSLTVKSEKIGYRWTYSSCHLSIEVPAPIDQDIIRLPYTSDLSGGYNVTHSKVKEKKCRSVASIPLPDTNTCKVPNPLKGADWR